MTAATVDLLPPTPLPAVIERFAADVVPPTRATERSAGYDLRAHLADRRINVYAANNALFTLGPKREGAPSITLMPGETAIVPTGVKIQLPHTTVALVAARSGKALKVRLVLANQIGVIDADYPEEWLVLATNASAVPLVIDHGEKIAQFIVVPYLTLDFVEGVVGQTTERVGGIGSTDLRSGEARV